MPFYHYKCLACQAEATPLQKIGDPPPPCPRKDWHGPMQKQLTAAGFQLKGDGWYKTDFKNK